MRGYRFYFFSREESRPHVHVEHATGEAKIWLEPEIGLAQSHGLTLARLVPVTRLVPLPGKHTLGVEVTQVSAHGVWILLDSQEVFAAFDNFPWFRDATIGELTTIERPSAQRLYWPALDVDLAVESLSHPERYPLVSRARKSVPPPGPKRRGSDG